MTTLETLLRDRLAAAFEAVAGAPADPSVRRSQHADFQADGALALARRMGRKPRDIAAEVVRVAELDDLCSAVDISGPGFITGRHPGDRGGRLLGAQRGKGDARRAPAVHSDR
jgi:arginyl-tRNA synthetase